jgi:hypothetical protein
MKHYIKQVQPTVRKAYFFLEEGESAKLWANGNVGINRPSSTTVTGTNATTVKWTSKPPHWEASIESGYFVTLITTSTNGNYLQYRFGEPVYPITNSKGEESQLLTDQEFIALSAIYEADITEVNRPELMQKEEDQEPQVMKLEPEKVDGTVANPNTSAKSAFKALNISTATPIIASRNTAYTGVRFVFSQEPGNEVKDKVHEHSWTASSNLSDFALGSTQTEYHKASLVATRVPVIMFFLGYQTEVSCLTCGKSPISLQAKGYRYFLLTPDDSVLIQETGTEKVPVIYFCSVEEFNNAHPNEAIDYNGIEATNGSATGIPETVANTISSIGVGASSIVSNPLEYKTNSSSANSNELTATDEEIETETKRVVASVSTTTNRSIKSYSNAEFLEMFPDAQIRELSSWDENSVISESDEFKDETHAIILGDYTIPLSLKDGLIASIFCDCDTPPMDAFSAYKDLEFTQLAKANAYVEVLTKLSTDADSISVDKTMYEAIKNQLLNNPSLDDLMCSITGMVLHKNFGQVGVEFDIPLNLLVFRDPSFTSVTNNSAEKWSATLADKGILVANRNLISYYSKKEGDKYFVVESSRWTLSSKCTVNLSDDYKVDIHMSSSTTVVKGPENPYKKETESDKTLKFSLLYSDPATTPIKVVMTESGARLQSSI